MPELGRYTISRKIAGGGMAEIYLGTQHGAAGFARPVVIKAITSEHSADPHFRNMLIDEAHIAMSLNHSNIVQVLDLGTTGKRYFLILEVVDGWDLDQIFKRAEAAKWPMPPEVALHITAEVCRALAYAHNKRKDGKALGIVHRDVSPHNILISEHGEVKLTDFGIAIARDKKEKTDIGLVKGKVGFMSPEQADGEAIDLRSDLFSLGTVLYLFVTGRKPFASPTDLETLLRTKEARYTPPAEINPRLPKPLCELIAKAMARAPKDRFESAEAMLSGVEKVLRSSFEPVSQTELKVWLAELGRRDKEIPASRLSMPPLEVSDDAIVSISSQEIEQRSKTPTPPPPPSSDPGSTSPSLVPPPAPQPYQTSQPTQASPQRRSALPPPPPPPTGEFARIAPKSEKQDKPPEMSPDFAQTIAIQQPPKPRWGLRVSVVGVCVASVAIMAWVLSAPERRKELSTLSKWSQAAHVDAGLAENTNPITSANENTIDAGASAETLASNTNPSEATDAGHEGVANAESSDAGAHAEANTSGSTDAGSNATVAVAAAGTDAGTSTSPTTTAGANTEATTDAGAGHHEAMAQNGSDSIDAGATSQVGTNNTKLDVRLAGATNDAVDAGARASTQAQNSKETSGTDAGTKEHTPIKVANSTVPDDDSGPGQVWFKSTPAGASVRVGKHTFGVTPIRLKFKPGLAYDVEFALEGYEPLSRRVFVPENHGSQVLVSLEKSGP